ncbi:MAG TPA: 2-phospho-L-lactate transferase, partial [Pseudolabrys sp.]|nr:2-phospho-L-lactate transferase [Pseudolabrys sp.]
TQSEAPVIAVSPIIGGQAVKGPTAKIMRELDVSVTTQSIAEHYRGLIDALVVDTADRDDAEAAGMPVLVTRTFMQNLADRERLARSVLDFADDLRQMELEIERASADA